LTISDITVIVNSVNIAYAQKMARYTETIYPVKKLLPLTADMAEAISEFRHRERISSENEAIRRLIEAGLNAADRIPIRGRKPKPRSGQVDPT
jgi:hypothetical protein